MEHSSFVKNTLLLIGIGVWVIVLQNAGLIPQLKPVKITSEQPMTVQGQVEVENTVFIKGQVDANLEAINGHNKFFKDPRTGEYYVIPVTDAYE
ncbi:MAG: hypothetical protein H3C41_05705 [Bacteroidales bacterium]|nr:hypothetical protein [Bacteroidales bacterium]